MLLAVLLGIGTLAIQNAKAGSAVASDDKGHLISFFGCGVEEAKRRALEIARSRYGEKVRLLTFTGIVGYGAIAVATKGTGSVVGIALGRLSPLEAEHLAIQQCVQRGGINPKVKWEFRG